MRNRIFLLLFVFVCSLSISPAMFAQATGSFSGTVTDKSGSVITGASVTITSQGTGVSRDAKTDDEGHFVVPLLPVGIYTLRVEFAGFQAVESKDVRLQVDEARELNFTLAPSSVSSQVEVSSTAVAVQTNDPSLGQVITAQQVTQLPLNGRDFVQLATLTPGTTQETSNGSFFAGAASSEVATRGSFSLSVAGSRANSTDWLLDGNDNNELTAGGIGILSSIDSIQEFKVLTYNYSAEYGLRAGPTVLVTTKSGGNDFHGSLFEFLRNTSLDARSFFAQGSEKFNLNQFGGAIGGPIRKNKTFFFIDGEQKYQRKGVTFTGLVPTAAMRAGDFSEDAFGRPVDPSSLTNPNITTPNPDPNPAVHGQPVFHPFTCDGTGAPITANADGSQTGGTPCSKIPSNLINPIAAQMIALYPLPNANNPAGNYNFVNSPVRSLDETKFDIRVDNNFSSSDNMFARFSYDQAGSVVPGGGGPGSFAESNAFGSNQGILNHGRNVAVSETHIFSPTVVNQFNVGYNRIFNYITSQGTGTCTAAEIGIPGANLNCTGGLGTCVDGGTSCGLTSTSFNGGYWALGDRGFSPFTGGTNVYSASDAVDLIRGKHEIKIGFSVRANQMNVRTEGFQDGFWVVTGLWSGNPESDFLQGLPSLAIHDQTFEGDTTGRRWKTFRPFVQDDWRITKNLTINLGFAWNLTTPVTEVADRQANFNPATGVFNIAGNGGDSRVGIEFDKRAVEPRIGFAWKPWGSGNTAVRGGYAIYHDSAWSQGAQGLWQNPPYYAESGRFAFGGACTFVTAACHTVSGFDPSAISLSDGFQIFTGEPNPADFQGTIQAQNTNFKLGTVQQFNINIEHQLPGDIVITAGYAGSRSNHILIDGNNLNVTSPTACGVVSGYTRGCGQTDLPFPAFPFSTVSNISDQGKAHYNGLQIKAETKSSRHGIYALVGYTYSGTYDNGFGDGLGTSIGATYYPLPGWGSLDWAHSQINLNHNFTASIIYDLPFGRGKSYGHDWNGTMDAVLGNWQVTVIEKVTSGFPVFLVNTFNQSGVNFQNNGNSQNRPDQIAIPTVSGIVAANPDPGCQVLVSQGGLAPDKVGVPGAWFNPCAFTFAAPGELGNANRAPVNGPGFSNTDFSLIKQFKLPWENMGLNFRAEIFNLFNHPQFSNPASDIASGGLGTIGSTVNNPRLFQFGLKLTF
jgi:hypothetical protein